jgi:hypothetical protein
VCGGKLDGHSARECGPARTATRHMASADYKVPRIDPVHGARGLGKAHGLRMRSVGPDAEDGARGRAERAMSHSGVGSIQRPLV